MADVRDILELERAPTPEVTKESLFGGTDKLKKKPFMLATPKISKRPEGMHREVFALLYNDNKDAPPLFPSDTGQGYKQLKAKLGMRKVRPWKWMPFTNPARKDGAVFHHWRRVADEGKEYPFAKFNKVRAGSGSNQETKIYVFDADHERRRKEQLKRLYERTPEQVEEEQNLISELRKIEARKKERDKKTQDLQKLITAADSQADPRKQERKVPRKKLQHQARPRIDTNVVESAGIKFPDMKSSGVFVRSQKMKLPANVGQKKMKAIEQLLQELNIELNPMPTEDICHHFNELRSDMVLLYELRMALATCEFELQTLRHQYEAFNPGKTLVIPAQIFGNLENGNLETSKQKAVSSEIIDVVGSPSTPAC